MMELPTDAERERLVILMEECSEVVHIAAKVLRHGYESYHPMETEVTNRELLEGEIGQMAAAVDALVGRSDVNQHRISHFRRARKAGSPPITHFQREKSS